MRARKRRSCSSLPDFEPDLDQYGAAVDDKLLDFGTKLEEALVLRGVDEAHHIFDAGAIVPATVEDHDFAAGGKARNVALDIHLALFAVARRRQRHDAEDARADALGDRLDRAALAGRVAALEYDDDPRFVRFDPVLQSGKARPEACAAPSHNPCVLFFCLRFFPAIAISFERRTRQRILTIVLQLPVVRDRSNA